MRIAVIGSGISGLAAAWLLSRRHDVVLLEKETRIGGHSHTVELREHGRSVPVDTGFIVYNEPAYPNLVALFRHLGVPTAATRMGFAVSCEGGRYEYSGNGLNELFGQRANLVSARHWLLLAEIFRFYGLADELCQAEARESLGAWLKRHRFGPTFIARHLLPMGAAIWSTPASRMLEFPAAAFGRFATNHGLMQVRNRPLWRTVTGGSQRYVEKILADFRGTIERGARIGAVCREAEGVSLAMESGARHRFDACVLACHADEALALLERPTARERQLLGAFSYSRNEAVLHGDARLMPKRRRVWSAWNYLADNATQGLCVTYWMNDLQALETSRDVFVTLNPTQEPRPELVERRMVYHHPVFDGAAMTAQRELWDLQGDGGVWFAGSYFGYGFHEDGLQAGLAVAEDLGGQKRPWSVDGADGRIHRTALKRVVARDLNSTIAGVA